MPLIATLRRTLRKILFMAFILAILLYEPAFRATLSILVNLHIFARMGSDRTQHTVRTYFPTIATWVSAAYSACMLSSSRPSNTPNESPLH
jgi:hypothetical protein